MDGNLGWLLSVATGIGAFIGIRLLLKKFGGEKAAQGNKAFLLMLAVYMVIFFGMQHITQKYVDKTPKVGEVAVQTHATQSLVGGIVKIPTVEQLQKPLTFDTNFAETSKVEEEQLILVRTNLTKVTFSTHGAVLDSIEYLKHTSKDNKPLKTVEHHDGRNVANRMNQPFLLSFDQQTPYFYEFVEQNSLDDKEEVIFQVNHAGWLVRKIYEIAKNSYKINLILQFIPKDSSVAPLNPKLFMASPCVTEIENDAVTSFVFNENSRSVEILELEKVQGVAWYWASAKAMIGVQDRYFAHSLVSDAEKFVQRAYFNATNPKAVITVLEGAQITEKSAHILSFYVGPKLYNQLSKVDDRLSDILSFGWLSWLCKIILSLLELSYSYIGNFGIAIIVVSILLRLPVLPLAIYGRMKTEEYQKHDPILSRIRAKYRQDQQMMQQELVKYHADHNISPTTPMIGCLPLLIQGPIMFALYRILNNYLELHQAPFFGWITDLSAKDPYYVLPILMGVTTLLQQQLAPTSNDGKQRIIMGFFAIVMTVVFANFAAGLVLYWVMNNVLTIGEDYLRKAFFSK